MFTYNLTKTIIERGRYVKEEMMEKLDLFLLANRITNEQYLELIEMMEKEGE